MPPRRQGQRKRPGSTFLNPNPVLVTLTLVTHHSMPIFPFLPGIFQLSASEPGLPVAFSLLPDAFLADISSIPWVAIVAIIGGVLLTTVVVIGGLWFAQRRQALWHETARLALEKGQPLPSLPHAPTPAKPPYEYGNDIRTGLIMIATGAGLYFFFLSLFGGWMCYIGAIPGFIGVALLLYGILNALFVRKDRSPADRPPQT